MRFVLERSVNAADPVTACGRAMVTLVAKTGPFILIEADERPDYQWWAALGYTLQIGYEMTFGRCVACGCREWLIFSSCWDCQRENELNLAEKDWEEEHAPWQDKLARMENNPDAL